MLVEWAINYLQPKTKDHLCTQKKKPWFFFCSQYIFAATAVGGSLVGTGTNINHGEREIIAGVENTNQRH